VEREGDEHQVERKFSGEANHHYLLQRYFISNVIRNSFRAFFLLLAVFFLLHECFVRKFHFVDKCFAERNGFVSEMSGDVNSLRLR
jgi:hypothetical protein